LVATPELQRHHQEQNRADGSLRFVVAKFSQRETTQHNAEQDPRK
jgi:hypothetical protein